MSFEAESQIGEHAQRLLDFKLSWSSENALRIAGRTGSFFDDLARDCFSGTPASQEFIRERIGKLGLDDHDQVLFTEAILRLLGKNGWNFERLREDYLNHYQILVIDGMEDADYQAFCHVFMDAFIQLDIPLRQKEPWQLYFKGNIITFAAVNEINRRLSEPEKIKAKERVIPALAHVFRFAIHERQNLIYPEAFAGAKKLLEEKIEPLLPEDQRLVAVKRSEVGKGLTTPETPIHYGQKLLELAQAEGYETEGDSDEAYLGAFRQVAPILLGGLNLKKGMGSYIRKGTGLLTKNAVKDVAAWVDDATDQQALVQLSYLFGFAAQHPEQCLVRNSRGSLIENLLAKLKEKIESRERPEKPRHGKYLVKRYSQILKQHAVNQAEKHTDFFDWLESELEQADLSKSDELRALVELGCEEFGIEDLDFPEEVCAVFEDRLEAKKDFYPDFRGHFLYYHENEHWDLRDGSILSIAADEILRIYLPLRPIEKDTGPLLDKDGVGFLSKKIDTLDPKEPNYTQTVEDLYHVLGYYVEERENGIEPAEFEPEARAVLEQLEALYAERSSNDLEKKNQAEIARLGPILLDACRGRFVQRAQELLDQFPEVKNLLESLRKPFPEAIAIAQSIAAKIDSGGTFSKVLIIHIANIVKESESKAGSIIDNIFKIFGRLHAGHGDRYSEAAADLLLEFCFDMNLPVEGTNAVQLVSDEEGVTRELIEAIKSSLPNSPRSGEWATILVDLLHYYLAADCVPQDLITLVEECIELARGLSPADTERVAELKERYAQDLVEFKVADLKRQHARILKDFDSLFRWVEEHKPFDKPPKNTKRNKFFVALGEPLRQTKRYKDDFKGAALLNGEVLKALDHSGWDIARIRRSFLELVDHEIESVEDPHVFLFTRAVEDVMLGLKVDIRTNKTLEGLYFKDKKLTAEGIAFIETNLKRERFTPVAKFYANLENAVYALRFAIHVRPQELIEDDEARAAAIEVLAQLEALMPPEEEREYGEHAQWLMEAYATGMHNTALEHLRDNPDFFEWLSKQEDTGHPEINKVMILNEFARFSIPTNGNLSKFLQGWLRIKSEAGELINFSRVYEEWVAFCDSWRSEFKEPDIAAASGILNRYLRPDAHGADMRQETLSLDEVKAIMRMYGENDLDAQILEELYHVMAFYLEENEKYPIDSMAEPWARAALASLKQLYQERRLSDADKTGQTESPRRRMDHEAELRKSIAQQTLAVLDDLNKRAPGFLPWLKKQRKLRPPYTKEKRDRLKLRMARELEPSGIPESRLLYIEAALKKGGYDFKNAEDQIRIHPDAYLDETKWTIGQEFLGSFILSSQLTKTSFGDMIDTYFSGKKLKESGLDILTSEFEAGKYAPSQLKDFYHALAWYLDQPGYVIGRKNREKAALLLSQIEAKLPPVNAEQKSELETEPTNYGKRMIENRRRLSLRLTRESADRMTIFFKVLSKYEKPSGRAMEAELAGRMQEDLTLHSDLNPANIRAVLPDLLVAAEEANYDFSKVEENYLNLFEINLENATDKERYVFNIIIANLFSKIGKDIISDKQAKGSYFKNNQLTKAGIRSLSSNIGQFDEVRVSSTIDALEFALNERRDLIAKGVHEEADKFLVRLKALLLKEVTQNKEGGAVEVHDMSERRKLNHGKELIEMQREGLRGEMEMMLTQMPEFFDWLSRKTKAPKNERQEKKLALNIYKQLPDKWRNEGVATSLVRILKINNFDYANVKSYCKSYHTIAFNDDKNPALSAFDNSLRSILLLAAPGTDAYSFFQNKKLSEDGIEKIRAFVNNGSHPKSKDLLPQIYHFIAFAIQEHLIENAALPDANALLAKIDSKLPPLTPEQRQQLESQDQDVEPTEQEQGEDLEHLAEADAYLHSMVAYYVGKLDDPSQAEGEKEAWVDHVAFAMDYSYDLSVDKEVVAALFDEALAKLGASNESAPEEESSLAAETMETVKRNRAWLEQAVGNGGRETFQANLLRSLWMLHSPLLVEGMDEAVAADLIAMVGAFREGRSEAVPVVDPRNARRRMNEGDEGERFGNFFRALAGMSRSDSTDT